MAANRTKSFAKTALRRAGFELHRLDAEGSFAKRRQLLLEANSVSTALDIGAHAGEYGQALRHEGYEGRIVSFEPLADHFHRLQAASAGDPLWECRQCAVGDRTGEIEIHISGNDGFSSSIREMASIHEEAAPSSSYVGSETAPIVTLDESIGDLASQPLMLKVDAQGYEAEVLAGATATLGHCQVVELELVLVELYEGQAMFSELVEQMQARGFILTDVEPGFRDERTSRLLQIDGLFTRPRS